MIGYLKGTVLDCSDGKALIQIQIGDGSIGYQLSIPQSPNYIGLAKGKRVEFFVYTHVREDVLDLYGFLSLSEKNLFLTLLSVNGIGPKGALSVLSNSEPSSLIQAILDGDKESLTRIPGIGKKTAERVMLELADPLKKKIEAGDFASLLGGASVTSSSSAKVFKESGSSVQGSAMSVYKDARDALLGLGYREQEIAHLLKKAIETQDSPQKAESLIRLVLQQLT